jgi:16S rRNA (cytosine967-C5)-methyltransferase
MRSLKINISNTTNSGWDAAVALTEAYLGGGQKADQLLDRLPSDFTGGRRSTCQSLFLGALRQGHRTRGALKPLLRKAPRPVVEAILLVAGFEIYDSPADKIPKIIHHAVQRSKTLAKKAESGMINAVLRKLVPAFEAYTKDGALLELKHSHPEWLVAHWKKTMPASECEALLQWNQQIPATYLRTDSDAPENFSSTDWQGFYKAPSKGPWLDSVRAELETGRAYIKDPSTRLAPQLLAAQPGETILDLCAAPGGKAFEIAQGLQGQGTLVALDLPGERMQRLDENLKRLQTPGLKCESFAHDLLTLSPPILAKQGLPETFDAILLDAPCSNTGVIQRRTDVKWRLRAKDLKICADLQNALLAAAAAFVKPGGRIVYSTCSIESSENAEQIRAFLNSSVGIHFSLLDQVVSYPWETGHDGAGAFLLKRSLDPKA